ncbi:unnamed protein product [Soboliphyme baturini]|uniref:GHMP_kinases_N domain-containing protein n=1 Tax=Soboliphyme baturini TaxID=241478 RepID=A0A183J614_9BILA|nr:unnamed protein product [Soboliphyme baturini]
MSVNTKRPISSLLQDVCYHFSGEYYRPPEVVVEAPGRVNLIGKRFCVPLETDYQIASYHPEWYDYFLCGFRGVVEYLKEHKLSKSLMKFPMQFGINVMIGSDIPPSAGLSSSSALVCCAALCALYAFRDNEGDVFESIDRVFVARQTAHLGSLVVKASNHQGVNRLA